MLVQWLVCCRHRCWQCMAHRKGNWLLVGASACRRVMTTCFHNNSYLSDWSAALQREYAPEGVDVDCSIAAFVVSNMSKRSRPTAMIPLPGAFVKVHIYIYMNCMSLTHTHKHTHLHLSRFVARSHSHTHSLCSRRSPKLVMAICRAHRSLRTVSLNLFSKAFRCHC